MFIKLLRRFSNPLPKRVNKSLKDAGVNDENVLKTVEEIYTCKICQMYKKTSQNFVVGFSIGR